MFGFILSISCPSRGAKIKFKIPAGIHAMLARLMFTPETSSKYGIMKGFEREPLIAVNNNTKNRQQIPNNTDIDDLGKSLEGGKLL